MNTKLVWYFTNFSLVFRPPFEYQTDIKWWSEYPTTIWIQDIWIPTKQKIIIQMFIITGFSNGLSPQASKMMVDHLKTGHFLSGFRMVWVHRYQNDGCHSKTRHFRPVFKWFGSTDHSKTGCLLWKLLSAVRAKGRCYNYHRWKVMKAIFVF